MADDVETEHLSAAVGGTVRLRLETPATAGYKWFATGDRDAVRIDDRIEPPSSSGGFGQSASQVFEFTPLQPGSSGVHLELRRPWDDQSVEERNVVIDAGKPE